MGLPAPNSAWPPPIMVEPWRHQSTARAWWIGDPDGIAKHYRGAKPAGGKVTFWSRFKSALTGQRPSERAVVDGDNSRAIHVTLASDLAEAYARSLFSESVTLTWPDETDGKIGERWETIAESIAWESRLLEGAQRCAGIGDVYLRETWDTDVAPHALISFVDAARVIPVFRHGFLTEATLFAEMAGQGQEVWRHLEHHRPGSVTHALYQGTATNLGSLRPLADHPSTADFADLVDETGSIATGSQHLAVQHIPAVRPAKRLDAHEYSGDLGQAITAGLESELDSLDATWTEMDSEMMKTRTRIFIAQHLLDSNGTGRSASFDAQRGFFPVTHQPGESDSGLPIKAEQLTFGVEKLLLKIERLVAEIVTSAGFSLQSLGITDGGNGETATAVHARTSLTRETREASIRLWVAALARAIEVCLDIDAQHCGGPGSARPKIEFQPFAAPTLLETGQGLQALRVAEAISTRTAVSIAFPGLTETERDEEVKRIETERNGGYVDDGRYEE